jgi:hypothetical protein
MSTFEHVVSQQSPSRGLSDPLTVGLARRMKDVAGHLRREPRAARLAVYCGFGGAVILQAGLFILFARLVLGLDSGLLPSLTASSYCLALGALVMLVSRPLADAQAKPAARRTRLIRVHPAYGDRAA